MHEPDGECTCPEGAKGGNPVPPLGAEAKPQRQLRHLQRRRGVSGGESPPEERSDFTAPRRARPSPVGLVALRKAATSPHRGAAVHSSTSSRREEPTVVCRSGYRGRVDLHLLDQWLAERGEPPYRAAQIWRWAARGTPGYAAMTNLQVGLRRELEDAVRFSTLSLERESESRDGTVKTLFRTHDGHPVEAVLMRYRDGRRSICVSSQSGCPLTCGFCATGAMRFGRNLTSSEILDQALYFRRLEAIDHCVFMGMGEPMLNLAAVLGAARRLPDAGVTHRRTTVSTVGWLPGLRTFVDEVHEPIRLALSLHAPTDELRSELMPVNERFPLRDVVGECVRYFALRRRKVFVEYVMLAGINDRNEQALELVRLLNPRFFKVNLIPYNPTGRFEGSSRKAIAAFKHVLDDAGLPSTVRLARGRDIAAACGQLAAGARPRGARQPEATTA